MTAQRQPRLLNAAVLLFFTALTLVRLTSLAEADIFFSIYHGQNILQGSAIVAPDSWNFQTAGEPWTSNSWLWDVVLAIAYNALGLIGVSLLNGACFALSLTLAWSICAKLSLLDLRRVALVGIFALASLIFFTARAVNADILLLLTFAWLALTFRSKLDGWKLAAVTSGSALVISALGMNLHLAASAFVLLLPAITAILITKNRLQVRVVTAVAVALASALGVLATPYGLAGVTKASAVAAASRRFIVEWNSPNLSTELGWIVLSVLLLALGLAGLLAWRKRYFSAALLLALDVAAYEAIRFTIYVLVLGFLLGAASLASWNVKEKAHITRSNQLLILGLASAVTAACAAVVVFNYVNPQRLMGVAASDYAPFAANSRVLSTPSEGSAILFYRRDVQVAVDGRNDLLGAKRYLNATNTLGYASEDELRSWLNRYKVDGAFLTTQQNAALGARFSKLGWRAHPGVYGVAYIR